MFFSEHRQDGPTAVFAGFEGIQLRSKISEGNNTMKRSYKMICVSALSIICISGAASLAKATEERSSIETQRERLLERIIKVHRIETKKQEKALNSLFASSRHRKLGQGNPETSEHLTTVQECLQKRAAYEQQLSEDYQKKLKENEMRCQDEYMVPLVKRGQEPKDASVCIDSFEFPNIPCEYPVVWSTANEASAACEALGKRLCTEQEWEGACLGFVEGATDSITQGEHDKPGISGDCATNGRQSPACEKARGEKIWSECGSNTFPSGFFTECRSSNGVYDLHGNVAEHVKTLPQDGTGAIGLKGSWFASEQRENDCRQRASIPSGKAASTKHNNQSYYSGFRCCKTIK